MFFFEKCLKCIQISIKNDNFHYFPLFFHVDLISKKKASSCLEIENERNTLLAKISKNI